MSGASPVGTERCHPAPARIDHLRRITLRIVERFTFDPQKLSLRRDYSVTDPVYLAAPYESYDIMYLSEVPFQKQPCKDLTPEFQKKK